MYNFVIWRNDDVSNATGGRAMRDFIAVMRALGEENRARAVMALQGRELCVCQIVELLGLAASTVSKHMAILKQARLVESRKDGRWMYYRPGDEQDVTPIVRDAYRVALKALADDPQIHEDARRLQEILALDPEQLCRRQDGRGC